ncbi:metabotropic glutamate receptor 1-like [Ornithodoros turicata]|uniref:metabotropic glutamate receptor 1-like n=1 Tax=Ornithodoros turicata TaxID=34597 RepID=UPI003139335E
MAMLDVAKHFQWTYVSAVYTEGNGVYGLAMVQAFRAKAWQKSICVATIQPVPAQARSQDYDAVLERLLEKTKATAVVCFCETQNVLGLLAAFKRHNATGLFTLLISDRWGTSPSMFQGLEKEAAGSIVVRVHATVLPNFDSYFTALNPDNNIRNPWFVEFWETHFRCSFTHKSNRWQRYDKKCTAKEDLRKNYHQVQELDQVQKAIYLVAYALDSMLHIHCGKNSTDRDCLTTMHVNSSQFLEYLHNTSFTWNNDTVKAGTHAGDPALYDILNYRPTKNSVGDYVKIGQWQGGKLTMLDKPMGQNGKKPPVSICSLPCGRGEVKAPIYATSISCCWQCVRCSDNHYTQNEYICEECPRGYRPRSDLSGCEMIPAQARSLGDPSSIICITVNLTVGAITVFVIVVFFINLNTPIVKASSREVSFVILFSIVLSNLCTFIIVAKPSPIICGAERVFPSIFLTMIHAAILTKTNRIARILAVREPALLIKKRRFMSTKALLIATALFTLTQAIISVVMLILEPPNTTLFYPAKDRVLLICDTSDLSRFAGLGFDFVVILLCTVYAIKTRNVPASFNEAKMIGFSMYATVIIWIAYVAVRQGNLENRELALCTALGLSGLAVLIPIFAPKVYVMLFRPDKNERSLFHTFKCPIGVVSTVSNGSIMSSTGMYGHTCQECIDNPLSAVHCKKLCMFGTKDAQ